jgi:hypothetical protein
MSGAQTEPKEAIMKMYSRPVFTLAVAALAVGVLANSASASTRVRGTFTLPYDVRWGQALLPAGNYEIRIDGTGKPALLSTSTGKAVALVMARFEDSALTDQPTSLQVTRGEHERTVRSFNWREGNKVFVYQPYTKAERRQIADAKRAETLPIRVAQK